TAAQVDSGLVVMASSGKGLAERIALGSTTGRVMHSLHRPLLIIPTGD
ncbi:MAG: universal stress protein, partial [Dehalococcoidia bacterium]|nr:universal stress protein [Dehalococcoidia bacterium]